VQVLVLLRPLPLLFLSVVLSVLPLPVVLSVVLLRLPLLLPQHRRKGRRRPPLLIPRSSMYWSSALSSD
jgi:hypothetical protein